MRKRVRIIRDEDHLEPTLFHRANNHRLLILSTSGVAVGQAPEAGQACLLEFAPRPLLLSLLLPYSPYTRAHSPTLKTAPDQAREHR